MEEDMALQAARCRDFLQQHPDFFLHDTELLQHLTLPHLGVGSASSLLERQVQVLRADRERLQGQVDALVERLREQQEWNGHLLRLAGKLLLAADAPTAIAALQASLQNDFAVEGLALLECGNCKLADAQSIDETTWQSLGGEHLAQVGLQLPASDIQLYFGEGAASFCSFASLRLHHAHPRGILLLGSADPDRYGPSVGTAFLEEIARLMHSSLDRFVHD